MPFGISLDDIKELPGIDSVTTSEEERRKRKKKKRPDKIPKTSSTETKKKKDDWFHQKSALGLSISDLVMPGRAFGKVGGKAAEVLHAPKPIKSAVKDVAEIGEGFIPSVIAAGKAGWHDRNYSLTDAYHDRHAFRDLLKWTLADEKGDKKKEPKSGSELADMIAGMIRSWGRGVERAVPDPFDRKDVREAKKEWSDHPLFAALNILPVGTAASRVASIGSRTGELGIRGAIRESYHPGAARRAGLPGGIPERIHTAQIGDEARTVYGRPWSRNPLMREGQRFYDAMYEASPYLQRKRVARVEERLGHEEKRQTNLGIKEMEAPVARVVYGRAGRAAGAFGLRSRMNAVERRRATALAYAFQMPKNLDHETALAAVQDDLTNILNEGKMEVPRGRRTKQIDLSKEERQALTTQIADLEKARAELRDGTLSHEEFRGALEAMQHMSDKAQDLGMDIMVRRYGLDEGEAAELGAAWGNRATILPRRLAARGRIGMELADSPERQAWLELLSRQLGDDEAHSSIAFSDALARGIRPEDPASFYSDRVGMPTGESAAEFGQRVQEGAFYQALHELPDYGETRIADTGFYSPLQKWVDETMPRDGMSKQAFEEALTSQIPPEEFYNVGIDMFLDTLPEGSSVWKHDFQDWMANPMNAYNLRVIHRVNTEEAHLAGYGTKYDRDIQQGTYVSRDPAPGEYHEVTMELPGSGRDITYGKTGRDHWERDNVVVHFRFHVFQENGVRKMLVDEIQSDWVNDFVKQSKRGQRYEPHTDLDLRELDDLRNDMDEMSARYSSMYRRRGQLEQDAEAARAGGDLERARELEGEWYAATDEIDALDEQLGETRRMYDQLKEQGQIPPSPVGSKTKASGLNASSYVNAPVRWMLRFADEAAVDEVVLVSREAQLLRNARVHPDVWNLRPDRAERMTEGFRTSKEALSSGSYRSYDTGKDIAKTIEREMAGQKGLRSEEAYAGHYRYPFDFENEVGGMMPGTVFKMTDDAKRIARLPKSYYQRQPNWKGLPKGANEILQGQNLIHIFEQGDVSTWIHELGHSALYDLHADDLATIEGQLAGGRKLADWTDMDHETFARAFEDYVRRGNAPTPQLAAIFRKLSAWVQHIWQQAKHKKVKTNPEVREVFDKMFAPPDASDHLPWGYLPHRDFTDLAQQEYRGGTRPPAAGQTIGIPRLAGDTVQRKPNELMLYQSGRLSSDPKMLVDVLLRRMRFQETLNARDELWAMGRPMSEQPPKGAWIIRNPDEAAERIRPEVKAAVHGRETDLPTGREELEALEGKLTGQADDIRKEMIAKPGEHPEWASDAENIRWVPGEYVETRFGEVFEQRPRGKAWSALGLMNSLQRTTGIYGRPIAYVGGNVPFNTMALMASMPVSTLRNAGRTIRMMKEDPELYRAIASETGETKASGGLPEFYTGATNRVQDVERKATQFQRASADVLSQVADSPFRVTAFLNNAAAKGFKTRAELRQLIRDGGSDLSDVRQMTREQLLDFDALNPSQRRLASNLLYLYPFIYASVKWPAMFAREYPARAALAANAAKQEWTNEPQSIANLWKEHGIDLSTLNPIGPAGEIAESLGALVNDPTRMDLTVLQDHLSPTIAAMVEGMGGGSKHALQNLIRQTIPGAPDLFSRDPAYRGGKQYADRSQASYLLQRYLRFWPRGINPDVIKERVDQFRKDKITTDTHELERSKDKDKINGYIKAIGGYSPEDTALIQTSYKSWWDYQEAVAEKKDSTGQRKLNPVQTTEILDEIVRENYPEYRDELYPMEVVRNAKDMSTVEAYNEELKKIINEGRTMVFDDYRSYASP